MQANKDEKKNSMVMAQEFLAKNGMPAWTAIERVPEGGETTDFKAAFDHFDPPVKPMDFSAQARPPPSTRRYPFYGEKGY